jgi:hypothetical protein
MLKTELTVKEYYSLENSYIKKIETKEAITENSTSIIYEDPSFELHKLFEDYLIRFINSIRKFLKVSSFIVDKEFRNHGKFVNHILSKLSPQSKNYEALQNIAVSLKEVIDYRNQIEHEELNIERFKIFQENNDFGISLPKLKNKDEYLRDYMERTIYQLFNYFEDMIALLLKSIYKGPGEIVALPKEEWDKHKGFKYIIDLSKK